MDEKLSANDVSILLQSPTSGQMTRRHVLRTLAQTSLAVGSASMIGGGLLTACGGNDTTAATEPVTLLLGDWPLKTSLLTSKAKPTDPDDVAELEIMHAWLARNKNVTIKQTAIDLTDPNADQKLQAALAARTCPSIVGTFQNKSLNRAAPKLKFAADVTEIYQQYNVDSLLADYARPYWKQIGNLDGKYYSLPGDGLTAGAGLYYRRDLLKAKGIADPQIGWTWNDLLGLLKQFQQDGKPVMGAPSYMFGYMLNSNLLDAHPNGVLGSIPAPKKGWHWQIDSDPWLAEWEQVATAYRKATLDDKLIEQNATAYAWEGPAMGKFAAGQFPFSPGFAFQGTITGYAPITPAEMPAKYGKTFDELVGFVAYPKGSNGGYNPSIYGNLSGNVMFPHYLKPAALNKAVDLYLYRVYGDGYLNKYARVYEQTKDPKTAYKFIAPANRYQKNPKLPPNVTIENAYGPKWVQSYMDVITKLTPMPVMQVYFPADKQTGPTPTAHSDLLEKLSVSKVDVATTVKAFQQTYNQQASSLTSDISSEDFIAGAKNYLAALDSFFKAHLPEFYAGDWTTYYHNHALPALS